MRERSPWGVEGDAGTFEAAREALERAVAGVPRARVAIVCGSGLSALAGVGRPLASVKYRDLPGLGTTTVPGHEGCWHVIETGGTVIHVLAGRRHLYEGVSLGAVTLAVRLAAAVGVERLLLTNAAGGLAPRLAVGDLMLITDHLDLMGRRAKGRGSVPEVQPRGEMYDPELGERLRRAALDVGVRLAEGVYAAVAGPNYETRAEVRMLRAMGADAVGMSTVPEAKAARALGLRVAAISLIANVHGGPATLSHEEVLSESRRAAGRLIALIGRAAPELGGPC